MSYSVGVSFHFVKQTFGLQPSHQFLSCHETILPSVRPCLAGHATVFAYHHHLGKAVPLAHLKIVRVVRRRNLNSTATEGCIDKRVGNHRYLTTNNRKTKRPSHEVAIPIVSRVYRNGGISQHGFWTSGCHGHQSIAVNQRVIYVIQMALLLAVYHLQI